MKPSILMRSGAKYPPGKEFHASGHGHFPVEDAGVDCMLYKNYEIPRHTHGFTELNLVIGGTGEHYIEDTAFAVEAGDVFVIPREVQHAYRQKRSLDVYHLLVSDGFIEKHAAQLWMLPGFILFFTVEPFFRVQTDFRFGLKLGRERTGQVAAILERIMQELAGRGSGCGLALESLALYAIALLCRDYAAQFAGDSRGLMAHPQTAAIQRAISHVEKNYARRMPLEEIARVAHMAPNHFGRVFRSATRLSPMEYAQRVRVRAAQNLLATTELSATEIALRCGFYDSAHFSRTFSKLAGKSPRRFRQSAR